jgi:hypothetical protein
MECIFFLCGLLLRAARRKPGEKDDSDEDGDENENPKKATPKKANFAMAESKAAEPKKRKAEPSASEGVLCRPPAPRSIDLCPRQLRSIARERVRPCRRRRCGG